ncbi:MAG: hypothetical protein GC162_08900 [Planctomycetes bacterium]|nr:hypothetical protein [Planctomycetota bacterium]
MPTDPAFSRRQALGASMLAAVGLSTHAAPTARADEPAAPAPANRAQLLAPDYSLVHKRDNPRTYVEGCGLITLSGGDIVAVVPVVPRGGVPKQGPTAIHIVRSADGGATWEPLSELPYYSAAPFVHDGALYLILFTMGTRYRNDDVMITKSTDGGKTWAPPARIFEGHYWNCHTAMVEHNGRLHWAIDDLINGSTSHRSPRAVVCDLAADPMNAASWRMSNLIPFPGMTEAWQNTSITVKGWTDHWLESNIIKVGDRLRMTATVKIRSQTTSNIAAVFDLDDDGKDLKLSFTQFFSMPGGHLKFTILRDEPSGLFWATSNWCIDSQETHDWYEKSRKANEFTGHGGNDRRLLMLMYSIDAMNWFPAGCIALAPRVRQSFMYPRPVIAGDDILVIARSSVDAPNQHDADCATFHRVRDFRRLALSLPPIG